MAVKEADWGTGRTGGREATTGVIPGRVALSVGCPDLEPPKGWKWTSLSRLAQLGSGHTPSRKHPEYWDGGIPWIGIKDATENHGRAKLDGRHPTGLDPATAALFPAAFQDSNLGHIPEGWTVEPVGEAVSCVGGGTPSTSEPKYWVDGMHHWTTPKDFSSLRSPILIDTERRLTDAGIAKISSGLLPPGTLLMSSRAPVGYLAISAIPVAINQGFIAMKCNERASNYFMLNWCQTNMAEIEGRATGTTFAEISKQNFRPIPIVLPPKELMTAFTEKIAPLYAQITANLRQSRTLATLRDCLLPKLLSGKLRVAEDEQAAKNVISLPETASNKASRRATDEFVEAVVIAQLVRKLASPQYCIPCAGDQSAWEG